MFKEIIQKLKTWKKATSNLSRYPIQNQKQRHRSKKFRAMFSRWMIQRAHTAKASIQNAGSGLQICA